MEVMPRHSKQLTILYVPVRTAREARRIAKALLDARLIACANIIPKSQSMYLWKNKIQRGKESLLIAKTMPKLCAKAEAIIAQLHSYDCPCIASVEVSSNSMYAKWVETLVQNGR